VFVEREQLDKQLVLENNAPYVEPTPAQNGPVYEHQVRDPVWVTRE
jgi:hypothetical protein